MRGANADGIPDLAAPVAGPLAGFAAAVAHLMTVESPPEFLLTLAVDTPFHPREFAAVAAERLDQGQLAVIAAHGGQAYPTNGLWRLAVLADLPRRVLAGQAPKSLMALASELGALNLDSPEAAGGNPFDNVNTLSELLALERRAMRNFGLGKAEQTR
jgi:molybdopterin-guanine dinucleotide biosynthesis protein A